MSGKDVSAPNPPKTAPKYNMWQNTAFMFRCALKKGRKSKSVLVILVFLSVFTAGKSVIEMLIAPVVLNKIESNAPLSELLLSIFLMCGLLLCVECLRSYADINKIFGRITVRETIIHMLALKTANTSYVNLLDSSFLDLRDKAADATGSNDAASEAVWTTLEKLLVNIIGCIVYVFLLSSLNFLLILLVTVTAFLSFAVNKKVYDLVYADRDKFAAAYHRAEYLSETFLKKAYAKDLRIFGLGNWLNELFGKSVRFYGALAYRREKKYIVANIADIVLSFLRNGIAYYYLINLTLSGRLTAAQFLLYFNALSGFTVWVTGILQNTAELNRQSLDLSLIREYLDWNEPFEFEKGKKPPIDPEGRYEITLEDVSYTYPGAETPTVSDINVRVRAGEKVALVGLNGAGKTTLVKLMCGFLDPTRGRVLLNGEDIRTFNRREYYEMIAAVFQEFSVLDVTIAENVAQRVEGIDEKRVTECLEKAGIREKAESLPKGINTVIGKKVFEDGTELSGGEMQRLMLARALYKDAPLLMLDEPTAALDPLAESDVYNKYNELTAGKTSVFVSHRLASTRFCDRILFLKDGKIAEEGTHDYLLSLNGGYSYLFNVQSSYYKEEGEKNVEA